MASNFDELDDSAFELPTDELIQPLSISKLEVDQETAEDANALVNVHLHRRPSPEPIGEPSTNMDEDSFLDQMIMALATDLRMFQEFERYRYRVDSDSDGESVPEDYNVDEADDEDRSMTCS